MLRDRPVTQEVPPLPLVEANTLTGNHGGPHRARAAAGRTRGQRRRTRAARRLGQAPTRRAGRGCDRGGRWRGGGCRPAESQYGTTGFRRRSGTGRRRGHGRRSAGARQRDGRGRHCAIGWCGTGCPDREGAPQHRHGGRTRRAARRRAGHRGGNRRMARRRTDGSPTSSNSARSTGSGRAGWRSCANWSPCDRKSDCHRTSCDRSATARPGPRCVAGHGCRAALRLGYRTRAVGRGNGGCVGLPSAALARCRRRGSGCRRGVCARRRLAGSRDRRPPAGHGAGRSIRRSGRRRPRRSASARHRGARRVPAEYSSEPRCEKS